MRTEVAASNYSTESWVNQAIAAINIPDISTKVNTADFDTYKAEADQKYFPKAGGELTGTFLMNKMDIAYPSFDFSSSTASGEKIFKILPFNGGTNTESLEQTLDHGKLHGISQAILTSATSTQQLAKYLASIKMVLLLKS